MAPPPPDPTAGPLAPPELFMPPMAWLLLKVQRFTMRPPPSQFSSFAIAPPTADPKLPDASLVALPPLPPTAWLPMNVLSLTISISVSPLWMAPPLHWPIANCPALIRPPFAPIARLVMKVQPVTIATHPRLLL